MNPTPGWMPTTWRLLLLAAILSISLIATGVFDPKPVGQQQWSIRLATRPIPPASHQIKWLAQCLPERKYTLRLTAAYVSGEIDVGYGLVIGAPGDYLAVAISPLGYVAIWQQTNDTSADHPVSYLLPWQTWPHINGGTAANEIWIDGDHNELMVRINRERLWAGNIGTSQGQIGLWGQSFGEVTAIDYQMLRLSSE